MSDHESLFCFILHNALSEEETVAGSDTTPKASSVPKGTQRQRINNNSNKETLKK